MWCPEGYITLHDLFGTFLEIADLYEASRLRSASTMDEPVEAGVGCDQASVTAVTEGPQNRLLGGELYVFREWLVAATLREIPPFLCSPEGVIMTVTPRLFSHYHDLEFFSWEKDFGTSKLSRIMEQAENARKSGVESRGFLGFHWGHGIVSDPSSVTPDEWLDVCAFDLHEVHRHFEGWAICFRVEDVPDDAIGLAKLIGLRGIGDPGDEGRTSNDRLTFIYGCIIKAYPNGKTDSWKVVEEATGYSRRSINRALEAFDTNHRWVQGEPPGQ